MPSINYKHTVWADEGSPFTRMTAISLCLLSFASCSAHKSGDLRPARCCGPSLTFSLHHVTSRTRPSRFSAWNIEKLGMGPGTRLNSVLLELSNSNSSTALNQWAIPLILKLNRSLPPPPYTLKIIQERTLNYYPISTSNILPPSFPSPSPSLSLLSLTILVHAEAIIMNFGLNCTQWVGPGCPPSSTVILSPVSADHTCTVPSCDPTCTCKRGKDYNHVIH